MERYWANFELTPGFLPVFFPNEVQLSSASKVSLYFGDTKVHRAGVLTLTTHRVLWINNVKKPTVHIALPLNAVKRTETKSGFLGLSSPKITLFLNELCVPDTTAEGKAVMRTFKVPEPGYMHLSFADEGRDRVLQQLNQALAAKGWEKKPDKTAIGPKEFSTASAGIQGIQRSVQTRQSQESKTISDAFRGDLKALMKHAEDMVVLATRYAGAPNEPGAADSNDIKQSEDVNSFLVSMGIANPVTKASAGAVYHMQLSRQLADFLRHPLKLSGGMMTLTDVYCMFNRARGTALVSPEDVLHACDAFLELDLPMRLRKFDSGVLAVQGIDYTDEAIATRIVNLLSARSISVADGIRRWPSLSADELAREWNTSLILTKQYLLTAEKLGSLCRDHTAEATRFYVNLFTAAR